MRWEVNQNRVVTQKPAEESISRGEGSEPKEAVYVPGSMSVILWSWLFTDKDTPVQDVLLFL